MQQEKRKFNLRKKPRKKVNDENNTFKERVPIYKTEIFKSPSSSSSSSTKNQLNNDPYEFKEITKNKTNTRRSSIIFDKFTYDIMRKIEGTELKKNKPKRITRKKHINKIVKKKQTENNKQQQLQQQNNDNINPDVSINNVTDNQQHIDKDNNHNDTTLEISSSEMFNLPYIQHTPDVSHSTSTKTNNTSLNTNSNCNHNISNPWRLDWVTSRPHFLSVKNNALPRIDQEMVLDSNLVENVSKSSTSTNTNTYTNNRKPKMVQKNLLHYFSCENRNVNENEPTNCSLFDSEELISPIKKTTNGTRTVLSDLTNRNLDKELSYFGFARDSQTSSSILMDDEENDENTPPQNNWRFNEKPIKNYKRKSKENNRIDRSTDTDIDITIMNENSMDSTATGGGGDGECLLFEEPEEEIDNDKITTCDKNPEKNMNKAKYVKKHKTKFEIEQENWIKQFEESCEEIDHYQLEIE